MKNLPGPANSITHGRRTSLVVLEYLVRCIQSVTSHLSIIPLQISELVRPIGWTTPTARLD